jgi:hypothetical protein
MEYDAIIAKLLTFINADTPENDVFNSLALIIFAYQFEHNQPFAKFVRARGKTPRTVKLWTDIPAVPINAFKTLDLSCCPINDANAVFMTSGTSLGGRRGKNYHRTLSIYDASMRHNFAERFMVGLTRVDMGILFPTAEMMPNSSLAHYLNLAVQECGTPESSYLVGEDGIDFDGVVRRKLN